jgi:hypothetical protein
MNKARGNLLCLNAFIQAVCQQGIQQTVVGLWTHESRTRDEPPPERRPPATPAWRDLCAHRSSNETVLSGVVEPVRNAYQTQEGFFYARLLQTR